MIPGRAVPVSDGELQGGETVGAELGDEGDGGGGVGGRGGTGRQETEVSPILAPPRPGQLSALVRLACIAI